MGAAEVRGGPLNGGARPPDIHLAKEQGIYDDALVDISEVAGTV